MQSCLLGRKLQLFKRSTPTHTHAIFTMTGALEVVSSRPCRCAARILTFLVPNGGYVTGCILEVVKTHFSTALADQNQPHTIALHVEFLKRVCRVRMQTLVRLDIAQQLLSLAGTTP